MIAPTNFSQFAKAELSHSITGIATMLNFRSTNDALIYGRNCSKSDIEKLRVKRAKLLVIGDMLRLEGQIQWAMNCLFSAQFLREATEAYMRKI